MKNTAWLVACLLALCSCSAVKKDENQLPNPPKRLQQHGFSFLPPAEDEWWIAQKGADSLVIARLGKVEGDSHAIEATTLQMPPSAIKLDRNRSVKELREKGLGPPRYRIRTHDISEQSVGQVACTLSYLLIEDRQPETGASTVGAMLLESMSLICPHPQDAGTSTMLTYTHRSFPEDQDKSFKARAGAVLATVQFTAL
jgi:hypothetical protein